MSEAAKTTEVVSVELCIRGIIYVLFDRIGDIASVKDTSGGIPREIRDEETLQAAKRTALAMRGAFVKELCGI